MSGKARQAVGQTFRGIWAAGGPLPKALIDLKEELERKLLQIEDNQA